MEKRRVEEQRQDEGESKTHKNIEPFMTYKITAIDVQTKTAA